MKVITPLSIDENIKRQIKEKGFNMSEIAENAFREKLNTISVEINKKDGKCEFCGKEMRRATRDNLNGLVWIFPFEQWACPQCEARMIKQIKNKKTERIG